MITHRLAGDPTGPPVLLLNGGMMSLGAWRPVTDAPGGLQGFQFVGCDFRGQLLSPGEPRENLAQHVDDLVELLDALELESVHVLGASFGGFAGLLLAARFPERVRSLVAVTVVDAVRALMRDNAVEGSRRIAGVLAGDDAGAYWDDLTEAVYAAEYRRVNQAVLDQRRAQVLTLPRSWWEGLLGIVGILDGIDLRADLPLITCPTLVLLAADDRVMGLEHGLAVANAIAHAELAVHPTAGHGLVLEDAPWVAAHAGAFLRRPAPEELRR